MQRRMIVSANDDFRAEATQTLSNLGTGSYGWQHSVSELLEKTTSVSLELFFQEGTPNLIESCHHPRPRQELFIGKRRKFSVVWQHMLIPLLHKRQRYRYSLFDLLQKTINEATQLTKCVVPVLARCLMVNTNVDNWNRNKYHRQRNRTTIIHALLWYRHPPKSRMWNRHGTVLMFPWIFSTNWSRIIPYQHGSYWGCDHDSYRFLEEEEGTAWISSEQVDRGTETRPSPSSKTAKHWRMHLLDADKTPKWKNLPQDFLHRFCDQSPPGITQPVAIPQQCSLPHRLGLAWKDRSWWWPGAMQDGMPSSPESLLPSDDSPQTLSRRTGPGTQTLRQQFAGDNASIAGDQMWGSPRALRDTHFPSSLQKPLPPHADPHAETQQMYQDQQHPDFWPKV